MLGYLQDITVLLAVDISDSGLFLPLYFVFLSDDVPFSFVLIVIKGKSPGDNDLKLGETTDVFFLVNDFVLIFFDIFFFIIKLI